MKDSLPAVALYLSRRAAQTIGVSASVNFDTIEFERGGFTYQDPFIIFPEAGLYFVNWRLEMANTTALATYFGVFRRRDSPSVTLADDIVYGHKMGTDDAGAGFVHEMHMTGFIRVLPGEQGGAGNQRLFDLLITPTGGSVTIEAQSGVAPPRCQLFIHRIPGG